MWLQAGHDHACDLGIQNTVETVRVNQEYAENKQQIIEKANWAVGEQKSDSMLKIGNKEQTWVDDSGG